MKKTLILSALFFVIFLSGCAEKNENDLSYINSVLSSGAVITVENNGVRFTVSDGKTEIIEPEILKGLTFLDSGDNGKAVYCGIGTDLPANALFAPYHLNNAIHEFENSDKKFVYDGRRAVYRGYDYDIFFDDNVSPSNITVTGNGISLEFEIISITK